MSPSQWWLDPEQAQMKSNMNKVVIRRLRTHNMGSTFQCCQMYGFWPDLYSESVPGEVRWQGFWPDLDRVCVWLEDLSVSRAEGSTPRLSLLWLSCMLCHCAQACGGHIQVQVGHPPPSSSRHETLNQCWFNGLVLDRRRRPFQCIGI